LGEAIVSGLVTPDTFTVRKSDGHILSRQVAAKERIIAYVAHGGTVELEYLLDKLGQWCVGQAF